MTHQVIFHPDAKRDFDKLDGATRKTILRKITPLAQNPEAGFPLGNKAGTKLAGCRKLYVNDRRIRVVYKIDGGRLIVFIVAVGKREDMLVYKIAASRL